MYSDHDLAAHVADELRSGREVMVRGQIHVEWFGSDEYGRPRMDRYGNPWMRSGATHSYQFGSGRIEVDDAFGEPEYWVWHPALEAGILVYSETDAKAIIAALHSMAS